MKTSFWILLGIIFALIVLFTTSLFATNRVYVTTYARKYSVAARIHPNRRYSPDRMNVAVGYRRLYGKTLWLYSSHLRVKVKASDVMNVRCDSLPTLHVDCSPRVMRALGFTHAGWIDSVRVEEAE